MSTATRSHPDPSALSLFFFFLIFFSISLSMGTPPDPFTGWPGLLSRCSFDCDRPQRLTRSSGRSLVIWASRRRPPTSLRSRCLSCSLVFSPWLHISDVVKRPLVSEGVCVFTSLQQLASSPGATMAPTLRPRGTTGLTGWGVLCWGLARHLAMASLCCRLNLLSLFFYYFLLSLSIFLSSSSSCPSPFLHLLSVCVCLWER